MPATTKAIREALAAQIAAGLGPGWQVSPYMLLSMSPPAVDMRPSGIEFHAAMRNGLAFVTLTVRVIVALNDPVGAQMLLDELSAPDDPGGLKAVIESDLTLGAVVQDVTVVSAADYKWINQEPPIIGVEFDVLVYP